MTDLRWKWKQDALLEPEVLVFSISFNPLLVTFILDEHIIRTRNQIRVSDKVSNSGAGDTYGNIMRDLVFLSSSCLGPSHFFQTQLSPKSSLKNSLVTVVGEKVQGPSNPELRTLIIRPRSEATIIWKEALTDPGDNVRERGRLIAQQFLDH